VPSRSFLALTCFVSVTLLPAIANACPVCFSANDANRAAYIGTTVLLTFLPLIAFATIALWLRRRFKQMEREVESGPEDLLPPF